MTRLFLILYPIIATAFAGTGVIVALTLGLVDLPAILVGAGAGGILAILGSWLVARRLLA